MIKREFETLLRKIEDIYPTFKVDEEEWWGIFSKYSYKEVSSNLQKYSGSIPPLFSHLIKNLKEEVVEEPKYIQCDLCRKLILVGEDWDVFEKHHRRCEKIDFIDMQSKEIHNTGITKSVYYEMSDEELEKNYRAYMNNWVKTHQDIAYHPEEIFKKI